MLETFAEGHCKFVFVFDEVVQDITKKAIEDLKCRVDFLVDFSSDELVNKHDQILPDGVVLVFLHCALHFDGQRTYFVGQMFGPL